MLRSPIHGIVSLTAAALFLASCSPGAPERTSDTSNADIQARLDKYTTIALTADLTDLSPSERAMIPLLIEAADMMDAAFWRQAYPGDRDSLLRSVSDPGRRRFVEINYGPWDRFAGDEPFIEGVGPKPLGAAFYPPDMSASEFEEAAAADPDLKSLHTMVRRNGQGRLRAVPYHEVFDDLVTGASGRVRQAANLAEDAGLERYLELRAEALLTDDYLASDLAWMDMTDNRIDFIAGPIETYEDLLFGYKSSYTAYVLLKDLEWSRRLDRYAALLPELQSGLPVPDAYKRDTPGRDSDLGAYDVIYYAGHANSGSKTIAVNLPNDERVQLEKGTRRLQLRNAMRAKFDKILVPIVDVLIAEDQRDHVTFDAFFNNTMFHEVAHGLGIKNTITGKGTVRRSLRDHASAMEEGKADVLGLYMVSRLHEQGEFGEVDLMDFYVTFVSGIFRSIRFGASSAHGVANMIRFNYFLEQGAFQRNDATGTYSVDFEAMRRAIDSLSERILTLQGDGDYEGATAFVERYGTVGETLQSDLDRLVEVGIPVDAVFDQGMQVLTAG